MEEEAKYYCKNCNARIESTDTVCPHCGKNLKEVGRKVEVFFTASVIASAEFTVKLTKKQKSIIKKVYQVIKNELAKKEIESITFGFPQLVSVTIKNKKDTEDKQSKEKS